MKLNTLKEKALEQAKVTGKSFLKGFGEFLKYSISTALVVVILTQVFILIAVVPTGSMDPTVPADSIMLCLRTDYWDNDPQRGDIIVFKRSLESDKTVYTKRVIGLPGDTVEIRGGDTYINGLFYDEPWLAQEPEKLDFGPYEVPEGKYFCMGDNRNRSTDCRYWPEHFVDRDKVLARGRIAITSKGFKKLSLPERNG